ncbi:MAG: PAS domain-containing protein [Synechococcaceae cyanobacterium RL_1_2]|nr:PAS domain-containing protein [Synechococcaceae cyanobacterium RL_1_2]
MVIPAKDLLRAKNSLIDSVVHPIDRAEILQAINQAIEYETSFDLEYRVIHQDGTINWVNNRGAGIFDDDGEVLFVDGVMMNITATKEMEYALRREKDQLYNILQHLPVDIALFDHKMRYLAYSDQWKQQYCPDQDELLGKCHYDVFPQLPKKWRDYNSQALRGEIVSSPEEAFDLDPDNKIYIRWGVQPWYTPEKPLVGL